jgi:hypothetical protein
MRVPARRRRSGDHLGGLGITGVGSIVGGLRHHPRPDLSGDTAWPADELTTTVGAHSAELVSASAAERALVTADPSFAVMLQRRPTSLTLRAHLEHGSMLPDPAGQR